MKKIFVFMLILCLSASLACAQANISEYDAGKYKVYTLPEESLSGNTGIFINAKPEDINKLFNGKNYPMPLNTFLIKGPKETILVDTGLGTKLFKHLETLKIKPEDITTIILTHMHGDHIGGLLNKDVVAFPNATIWVAQKELDYWTNKEIQAKLTKVKQSGFVKAQRVAEAYKGKVRTFEPKPLLNAQDLPHYSPDKEGTVIIDGVRALAAYGHTPGHTAYFVGDGANAILIWGDIVHVEGLQMPKPDVGVIFDVDPAMAREVRFKLLDFAMKHNVKVGGMHLGRAGASLVKKTESGYSLESVK